MNYLAFSLHRADQRMLALQRAYLQPFGITPARYLLLLFIKKAGRGGDGVEYFMHQSEIWKTLGVRPPTISKMLKQLEALGLVRRTKCGWSQREVLVFLTRKARGILYRVDRIIVRPGVFWMATYTILQGGVHVGRVEYLTERIRNALLDYATTWFPHCGRTLYPERRFKPPKLYAWPGMFTVAPAVRAP